MLVSNQSPEFLPRRRRQLDKRHEGDWGHGHGAVGTRAEGLGTELIVQVPWTVTFRSYQFLTGYIIYIYFFFFIHGKNYMYSTCTCKSTVLYLVLEQVQSYSKTTRYC